MRLAASLAGLAFALLGAGAASAIAATDANGPWLAALSARFTVVDLSHGDLDGDGKDETLVCYRGDQRRGDKASGIAILTGKGPDLRPAFHVQLDRAVCEKVRSNGRKLGILLSGNQQLVWTYGEDIKFRRDKGGVLAAITATASSSLAAHGPDRVLDGDVNTSWAEAKSGTGLGQTLTLQLPRPMTVGMVGVFSGAGASSRAFSDSNRVHRASIEAKTDADLGDSAAGVDFSSLGIDSIGDRVELRCEDQPQVTYVTVDERDVMQLQLRVESVYLGDRKDDTHIAEIEVVPVLSPGETLDKATAVKPKSSAPAATDAKPKSGPAPDARMDDTRSGPTIDEAVKKLDKSRGSIVEDDDDL